MFTLLFRIAQKLILIYHSDPLCFYPCDLAPLQSPPPTPPPRFHPSDSAPSASTPPTRPLWGWGGGGGSRAVLYYHLITINVPLFKKLWDLIFFWWDNHFMSHFEGHFEGAKTFLTP